MTPILRQIFAGQPNPNAETLTKLVAAQEAVEELGELFGLRINTVETDKDRAVLWLCAPPDPDVFTKVARVHSVRGGSVVLHYACARHREVYVQWPLGGAL